MTTSKRERKNYITVLSVLASLAVVLLHTNGIFWKFSREGYWASANVIESLFYFAVPIFFMISGANLIDYRERYSTKEYFKKRLLKVGLPFVVWSLLGLVVSIATHQDVGSLSPLSIINGILNSRYIGVYWFFIPLFAVYLAIPVLSAIDKNKRQEVFKYMILVGLLLNSVLPFASHLIGFHLNDALQFFVTGGYIIYAVLGYYLDHYEVSKRLRIAIYILGVAGLLTHLFGTYFSSMAAGEIVSTFKGYINVPTWFYSAAIFLVFKRMDRLTGKIYKAIVSFCNKIVGATFGVYLLHMFILQGILKFVDIDQRSLIWRMGGGVLIYILAIVIIKIMQKIPVVRSIVP